MLLILWGIVMNIYTVSFFGHRKFDITSEIEKRLDKILCNIISQNDYIQFLIGREGDFDLFAASKIKSAINKFGYGNTSLIFVLPYMKADYLKNKQGYHEYYDEIEICFQSSDAYFKSAIQIRNKNMVNRSNLVICCIQHKSGGAYKTIQYAKQQNCQIINIADVE